MQGPAAGTPAWPALGGSTWAAKATTPVPVQALPPPPPPVEAVQEWPTLGRSPSDAADSLPGFKGPGVYQAAGVLQAMQGLLLVDIMLEYNSCHATHQAAPTLAVKGMLYMLRAAWLGARHPKADFKQRGARSMKKVGRRLDSMCAACWKHELNDPVLEDAD